MKLRPFALIALTFTTLAGCSAASFDREAVLSHIHVPTLLLTGEHDRKSPAPTLARMAAQIEGSRWVQLPGIGDFIGPKQRAGAHRVGAFAPHQQVKTFGICGQPGLSLFGPSGVDQRRGANFQRDPRDRPGTESLSQSVDQLGISNRKPQP